MKIVSGVLVCFLALLACVGASAQGDDWRSVLQGEKAKTAERMAAINQEAAPMVAQLKEVNAQRKVHDSHRCQYPPGHPEVCAAYAQEAKEIDTATENLRSQLIPLSNELDRLQARSSKITQLLAQPKCGPACQQLKVCAVNPNCFD